MGINVYQNKSVTVDHTHQQLVDTSLEGNPTEEVLDELHIQYVFRRKAIRDHKGTPPTFGDGNPLVYALKRMHGYSIQPMYEKMLFTRATEVLGAIKETVEADFLVDVPSSKPLCRTFLDHSSKALELPTIYSDFLAKRTIGEVLSDFDDGLPDFHSKNEERGFKDQLGKLRKAPPETVFQMKSVDNTKVRHLFQPFDVTGDISHLEGRTVLLVDDLVSSGTSVTSVAKCLQKNGVIVRQGICLLSSLSAQRSHDAR